MCTPPVLDVGDRVDVHPFNQNPTWRPHLVTPHCDRSLFEEMLVNTYKYTIRELYGYPEE